MDTRSNLSSEAGGEGLALKPGELDVLDDAAPGTPPRMGLGQKPPVYLKPGNTMRRGIEGLGEQRSSTRAGSR